LKPNIIFILIDDMGWRDLTCYGSTFYETPNIDRLARDGVQFSNAYASCPVCSPTRASILTGKYPATLGLTDFIHGGNSWTPLNGKLLDVPYAMQLPLSETTVAKALREGGYQTWHIGKWHLGSPDYYPGKHGFDINIGGCQWGHPNNGYFSPWGISTLADGPEGAYLTDHLTDEAIKLIENRNDSPFFLNMCHYAVHTPIQAPAHLIAKYEAKARALGLDTQQTIVEGEQHPADHMRHLRVQRRIIQSDPAYAAMIENLDANIGRLLAAVDTAGIANNTIVIFTSDNGGLATSEGSPTSNRPLAEGKGWMYEGGTREPLIVKWPDVIAPGSTCDHPIASPDFYPTFLEACWLPLRPEQHVDGTSFLSLLKGENEFDRGPIFWHYPHYGNQGGTPGSSIRLGDYKLIEFYEDGRLELYNLQEDLGETRNLADTQPQIARELHKQLVGWRNSIEAKIPRPNPAYDTST